MPPDTAEVPHYPTKAQQVFYILSGTTYFQADDTEVELKENESIHIPAKTVHRIKNRSGKDLTFLVTSQPKSHGDRIDAYR